MIGFTTLARRLLTRLLPEGHRDVVLTHLDDEHALVMRTQSPRSAARWYRHQITSSLPGAMQLRLQGPRRIVREFFHDARYGLRQLRQSPGFSIAAVFMLAIGLGLVSGAYTVVNGLFVRGWDVPDSARVFRASASITGAPEGGRINDGFSYGAYRHIRDYSHEAEYVAFQIEHKRLGTSQATAVYSAGLFVSDNFIDALRIPMQQGPGFSAPTTNDGARVVLSDKLWKSAFNGDPGVVGQSIWVSGKPATVVGITAPGFGNLAERAVDFMVELSASPLWAQRNRPDVVTDNTACCVSVAGRMGANATVERVREELALLTAQYRQSIAQPTLAISLRDTTPMIPADRGLSLALGLIGAGVVLVWMLTCANVGNLFLARSLKRDREIAVRLALGASRGRLVRQLLAEGFVLAVIAGAAALGLAAGVPLLMEQIDGTAAMYAPDLIVVSVAGFTTIATCVLVALAPALHATQINWKGAGRTTTARPGRMREVVLAVQIGVATVLVLSATLISRGITQAAVTRADFALHTTTAFEFEFPSTTTEAQKRTAREAVRAAVLGSPDEYAMAESIPASERAGSQTSVRPVTGAVEYRAKVMPLSAAAFQLLDVPLLEGRPHADHSGSGEAVINNMMARRLWPDSSALGKVVQLNYDTRTYTVVGVTKDTHLAGLGDIEPLIHISSDPSRLGVVLARTTPGTVERVSALAKAADPGMSVTVTALSSAVRSSLNAAWTGAAVAGGLGTIALLLAVIGVFGVFSYLIEERRREIGIRLALGATKRQIRVALAHASRRPVAMGLAFGLGGSVLAATLLRGFLFGLSPLDPISYMAVAVVLMFSAAIATAVPVRRALRVDPATTLRAD